MPPKVSILTPCFGDRTAFLPQRIDSILNQTYQDFEWILVDDGCVEASQTILQKLLGHPRVKTIIHHPKALGVSRSYNEALALAEGEFILRAEDDDYCELNLIEKLVAILDKNPDVGLAFTAAKIVDSENRVICYSWERQPATYQALLRQDWIRSGREVYQEVLLNNYVHGFSQMFRRKYYLTIGPYDTDLEWSTDCDFVLRVLLESNLAYISEPLVNYRKHSGNLTDKQEFAYIYIGEYYRLIKKALQNAQGKVELSHIYRRHAYGTINTRAITLFIHFIGQLKFIQALRVFLVAFSNDPKCVLYLLPVLFRRLITNRKPTS